LADDPGSKKCIFKRGTKYPERVLNSSKSAISIMFAGSAAGEVLPPYVCYKAERLWDTWVVGGPDGTRYNRSKSGWIDEVTFADWFQTILLPWAKTKNGRKVVIGDNLSTHFSPDVIKSCNDNDILFVCLPPNATHLLQPLDVAFFRPLKQAWRKILCDWKVTADRRLINLPKNHFPSLLRKLCDEIKPNAPKNLEAGFKACGIYPLDPQVVMKKLPITNEEAESPTKKARELVGEGVIDLLTKLRYDSPGGARAQRKKKINVAPGKSISQSDLPTPTVQSNSSLSAPGSSGTSNNIHQKRKKRKIVEEDLSDPDEPDEPEESLTKDSSDEWTEEPPENDEHLVFKDPEVGDWLLVKFAGKKATKHYVALVEEKNIDLFVRCARNIGNNQFKWPDPEDRCSVDYDQIERRLEPPTFNYKNDRLVSFVFKNNFAGYTVY
jgi:hypothetical protein